MSGYVNFLDIKFGFDNNGNLQTDLFRKETDSRAYLDFKSCHPNHIFSSIIYSQALRIRRIVNDQTRLEKHLNDMVTDFRNSNYPFKLITNIVNKVKSLPRDLYTVKNRNDTDNIDSVKVISTYGCDEELCKITDSVSELVPFKLKYVKRTGTSLNKMLCKSKHISTGPRYGKTLKCNRNRCQSCNYMSNEGSIISTSGKICKTAPGNCSSRNLVYAATCKLCSKFYTGKTTQMLCGRICEHKSCYNKYRKAKGNISVSDCENFDDKFALSVHLYNHHKIDSPNGFEDSYKFTIIEKCSPKALGEKEHLWIQDLRCLYPLGLNLNSPLALPLLL